MFQRSCVQMMKRMKSDSPGIHLSLVYVNFKCFCYQMSDGTGVYIKREILAGTNESQHIPEPSCETKVDGDLITCAYCGCSQMTNKAQSGSLETRESFDLVCAAAAKMSPTL